MMTPSRIKAIRTATGLTQPKFAATYGITYASLLGWEQGRRSPSDTAETLLRAIEREPETMRRLLAINSTGEIEITPAMIDAGKRILGGFNHDFDYEDDVVVEIYKQMVKAKHRGVSGGDRKHYLPTP